MFSITDFAYIASHSVFVSSPLDVSGIAIDSQLATINTSVNQGDYNLIPPSILRLIFGVIMALGCNLPAAMRNNGVKKCFHTSTVQ